MNTKIKNSEIPEKILSQNLLLLQDFNKQLEIDLNSKLSKNKSQKLILQTIFELLNSQITLIFRISKINESKSLQKTNNNINLLEHIISFNKELISKQIQKIISFVNISHNNTKKNTNKKNSNFESKISTKFKKNLNSSFLMNSSFKINNKNIITKNKTFLLDIEKPQDYRNFITQTNENIENNKNYMFNSYTRYKARQNISSKKKIKKFDSCGNCKLNHKLIKNKNINKINTNDFNINIKKNIYFTQINKDEEFSYKDNNNDDDEENPVRKVKKIIINAKRNNSMNRNKFRINESTEIKDFNNYEIKIKKNYDKENKNNRNLNKLNSNEIDSYTYKNLYKNFSESIREIKIKDKNINALNNDINFNYNSNIIKREKKDRESRELLHDGMKNIKNKLIYNKLHKKD